MDIQDDLGTSQFGDECGKHQEIWRIVNMDEMIPPSRMDQG